MVPALPVAKPITLFRTTAAWFESEISRGGKRLCAQEVDALHRLKSQVSFDRGEDIRSAQDLIDKLIEYQPRIEQQRY